MAPALEWTSARLSLTRSLTLPAGQSDFFKLGWRNAERQVSSLTATTALVSAINELTFSSFCALTCWLHIDEIMMMAATSKDAAARDDADGDDDGHGDAQPVT